MRHGTCFRRRRSTQLAGAAPDSAVAELVVALPPRSMKDTRWLWIDEQLSGPYSVDQLYRVAQREEIGPQTLFWSDSRQVWLPLTGVMFDIEPAGFRQVCKSGITRAMVLDSGTGEDCSACHALTGSTYPIAAVPTLPPAGCTCFPWCRCTIIGALDED